MKAIGAYLGVVWQILRKDIRVEWRGRQGLPVMLMFALMIVFLFNFALQLAPDVQAGLTSGLLWVSLAFASTLGLNRSISLERENNALDGLLLAPVDRSAIFFGKTLGNFCFTTLVGLLLLPVFSLFYGQNLIRAPLLLVMLLGLAAYTSLGTLLSALSIQARTRDVLLPVLLYPLALPILIAAVEASRGVLAEQPLAEMSSWIYLLLAGTLIFNAAGLLFFETILEE
ncbi:MAG TPA: heme exporter protein CcmB [Brevefilum sp.]|nr:heme exporter protein CcmB [Brevefilum sp.]HOR19924.1 heme exporter protein CcmB [Brevefilum sp.]HPL69567.1 heme exporter protein CcmB [Brevefilum sp.]